MADWNSGATSVTGYLNPTYIVIGITAIGFFSSKNNFSGPLRYGVTKYGSSIPYLYQKAPGGSIWILILLRAIVPWSQIWVVSVLAVIWQYTLQHFREDVRDVMDTANNLCARATIATTSAKEDVEAALRYEQEALANGSQAIRDARQAEEIKASDFFSAATNAWTAIGTANESIKKAREYSSTACSTAESARSSYANYSNSSASSANNYANYTQTASTNAEDAYKISRAAINAITSFENAKNQDTSARKKTTDRAKIIQNAVKELLAETAELPKDLATLLKDAQAVRHKVSQAVAKAEQGALADAGKLSEEAQKELEELEEEASRIAGVKDDVRKLIFKQFVGNF